VSALAKLRVITGAPASREEQDDGLSYRTVRGRLCELSTEGASAVVTAATRLIVEAQARGELCAWLGDDKSLPFAEDLAANGVDLASLVVCRLNVEQHRAAIPRAADQLLRSGAFGLVVCDLIEVEEARSRAKGGQVPQPLMVRLAGLVRKHQAAVVFLTEKPRELPSLGSLISMRAEVRRERPLRLSDARARRHRRNPLSMNIESLKDKRRAPGWSAEIESRGPAGMG
jgi:recombination protein RecA